MVTKHIPVSDESEGEIAFEVKRAKWGEGTVQLSVTIPKRINQTINGIAVKSRKSRSLVITELLEKGLNK